MAYNIVTSCMKDDPNVSLDDVRRLKLSLDRERIFNADGMLSAKFFVITDYDRDEFNEGFGAVSPKIISVELEEGEQGYSHPSFYQRFAFDNHFFSRDDKVLYLDANCIVRDLFQTVVYSGLPERGNAEHSQYELSAEDIDLIETENLETLFLQKDWTEKCETQFQPWFYAFNYGDQIRLQKAMREENVFDGAETFMHWIEENYKGYVLQQPAGLTGPFVVGDQDENERLAGVYEKNVRPLLGTQWRGLGGEKDEQWCVYDHEYRDVTRQCSILYFDRGDEYIDPLSDRYVELWLI